jgi:hypothetical protein
MVGSQDRKRMWKQPVVAQVEIRSWHLAGYTEETAYSLSQVSEPRFELRTSRICSRNPNHLTSYGERYILNAFEDRYLQQSEVVPVLN